MANDNALFAEGERATELLGTKAIEDAMQGDFENWVRWGRSRDWMPRGFRCPLGFLYKSSNVMQGLPYRPPPCDEREAERLEKVICSLPRRMREAFVMHRLDRAHIGGYIIIVRGRRRKADILGVSVRTYHRLVRQAHRLIWARWNRDESE